MSPGFTLRFSVLGMALVLPMIVAKLGAQTELADLREDVSGLTQKVNDLSLRVEQLEHENAELKARVGSVQGERDSVSQEQLNRAVADLNGSIRSAVATSRQEILEKVANQMENLARQTNAALDSIAKPISVPQGHSGEAPSSSARPPGDSPGQSVSYVVVKGDTLGVIARKTGSRVQDIIDANKIADPSRIVVGQTLVIPNGRLQP